MNITDVFDQPHKSRAILTDMLSDGLKIELPPLRLRSNLYLGLLILWIGMLVRITSVIVIGQVWQAFNVAAWICFGVGAFVAICLGLSLLVQAIDLARRRAILRVTDQRLTIVQSGLGPTLAKEWNRDDLLTVVVGPSKIQGNDRRVPELKVLPKLRPPEGFFVGHPEGELLWIATQLRSVLEMKNIPEQ